FIPTTASPMPLCLCTVDTTSTKNIVNWEKPSSQGNIDSFKIYRNFGPVPIATLPYSHLSSFTDTTAGVDPNLAPYEYQLTYVTTGGVECAKSNPQKTMYLQVTQPSPPAFKLDWTEYFGSDYVGTYRIMRDGNNTGNFVKIDSVPCNTLTYTDPNPPSDSAAYYIETITTQACNITFRQGGNNSVQGTIVRTRSNVKNNRTTGILQLLVKKTDVKIYPNPNNGEFNLTISQFDNSFVYKVEIYNVLGEKVYNERINSTNSAFNISDLSKGVYQVQLSKNNIPVSQNKIVKQ
ncbi:MAG: T9SS type A sorting domain-containing protein, partial [Bacteroidia bacterium]